MTADDVIGRLQHEIAHWSQEKGARPIATADIDALERALADVCDDVAEQLDTEGGAE